MDILKETLWIFPQEKIQILEIYKKKRRMFYHYEYILENKAGDWEPRIVWHNFENIPHFDIFDSSGRLILRKEQEPKDIKEIVKLVKIFRKNLMNMDLSTI